MTSESSPAVSHPDQPARGPGGRLRWLWQAENLLVALALAVLMLLPLIEIVGRKFFHGGLNGGAALQQHLVLIIGLLGGMFAARDRRLLSLSTLTNFLTGRWQTFARVFSSAFAAGITVFLCLAALQLVQSEKGGGKILAYGIPIWTIQGIMPLGFGVIALRLLWHAADTWRGRLVALLVAGSMVWIGFHPPLSPARLVVPGLVALLAAVVLGAPIFVMLGGAALILFWGEDTPIASISLTHYSMVTNPTLPTLPLFTLAGYFLAEGGASKRLIRVFQAWLGQFRGGPAIVTVLACAFFSSFTGASGVTILALGGLLMPVLMGAGYSERSTLGMLTGSGGLGLLFPPSLPLILFAIVAGSNATGAGVTIEKMFLAGFGPACCWWAWPSGWACVWDPKTPAITARSTGARRDARSGRPNGNCSCPSSRWSRSLADSPPRWKQRPSPPFMRLSSKPFFIATSRDRGKLRASWPSADCSWAACCSFWAWRSDSPIT